MDPATGMGMDLDMDTTIHFIRATTHRTITAAGMAGTILLTMDMPTEGRTIITVQN